MLDVLSAAPDPILVIAADGHLLAANPAVKHLWHWPVERLLDQPLGDRLDTDLIRRIAEENGEADIAIEGAGIWRLHAAILDGTRRRFVATARRAPRPGRTEGTGGGGMKFYASDLLPSPRSPPGSPPTITARRASDLLAAMPDGLAVLSLDGVVRAANRPFERLMNRSIAEMRGRPLILLGSTNEIVAAIDGAVSRMRQLDVAGTLESGRTVFASVRSCATTRARRSGRS